MKYLLSFVILTVTYLSFSQTKVTFNGRITHPNNESVSIFRTIKVDGKNKKETISTAKLDEKGSFQMTFEVETLSEMIFNDGNESTTFLIQPGDELFLTLNTKMFDETIEYYGKGAEKNNAIKNMALMAEYVTDRVFEFNTDADTNEVFTYIDFEMSNLIDLAKDYQSIEGFQAYGDQLIEGFEKSKTDLRKSFIENLEMMKAFQKLVGSDGIDIKGVDLNGEEISLSQFKGKVIVIDFWAPWCAPCRAEMPAYKELEDKYGEEIIFISLGVYSEKKSWKKMAIDLDFKHNIFVNKEGYSQFDDWMVNYIPRYVVLDKEFKIVDADAPRPSSGELEKLILELKK